MIQVVDIEIDKIIPYKNNIKIHTDTQIELVSKSIQQYGMLQPIIVDKNNIIVAGHCRYEAYKLLNMQTIPCICASELTEKQIKQYRLLDNRLNESSYNFEALTRELDNLDFSFDLKQYSFNIDDITQNTLKEIDTKSFTNTKDKKTCPHCGGLL